MIRQPIKIYTKTNTRDEGGGFVSVDELLITTLASVTQFTSAWDNELKQVVSQDGIKCQIWKRLDFSPSYTHFVEWKGSKYQIKSVTLGIEPSKMDSFTAIRIKNA